MSDFIMADGFFDFKTNDWKLKAKICHLSSGLQHIEQDERVSMGLNGDLYFSHAVEKDSRRDYCCFAAFPRIRTIVQKTAMSVIVKTSRCHLSFFAFSQALFYSQPSMMQTLICLRSTDHFQYVHWYPYS